MDEQFYIIYIRRVVRTGPGGLLRQGLGGPLHVAGQPGHAAAERRDAALLSGN
jgi:hypothetical protein